MQRAQRNVKGEKSEKRIVAKFGTNLLTAGTDSLDHDVMAALVGQVARLHGQGLEVIVVSSGAIAAGRQKLGLLGERRDIPSRQVMAAVGQNSLMSCYEQLFGGHGITVAQTLLTKHVHDNLLVSHTCCAFQRLPSFYSIYIPECVPEGIWMTHPLGEGSVYVEQY